MQTQLSEWSQLILNGAAIGAIYALVALGLVLSYKTTEVLNFAHGDIAMLAAFLAWSLIAGVMLTIGIGFMLRGGVSMVFGPQSRSFDTPSTSHPELLLLDEPSLGLSPLLTREIFSIIQRINKQTGISVLMVEQNAPIALANAHDRYILELGRVAAADTCAALMQKDDVREFYLGMGAGANHRPTRWKRKKTWR